MPSHSQQQKRNGLFWTAKLPELPPLHFFGALHFGTEQMYPLPQVLEDAYHADNAVAFETNLGELSTPQFNAMMTDMGRQSDGTHLSQNLKPDTWKALSAISLKLGYSPEYIDTLQSWYCASSLTSAALKLAGLNSHLGIDGYIFQRSVIEQKPVICLETPQKQLELLASINPETDEIFIQHTVKDLADMAKFSHEMLDFWLEGNAKGLAKLVEDGFENNDSLQKLMLEDRNRQWFNKLHNANAQNLSVLSVVGAGHLVGPNSILNLFREYGYVVTVGTSCTKNNLQ